MDTLSLSLFVDKNKNRVLFAESDRRFVEILLTFLTLPVGTVVRLLDKHSTVGCLDELYESVERLDKARQLQTSACKAMLLQPRSEGGVACEYLLKTIDGLNPRRVYRCKIWECFTRTHCLFSTVPGARCRCGDLMVKEMVSIEQKTDDISELSGDGTFLKGESKFVICDDLHVTPASSCGFLSLLPRFGIKNLDNIEMKSVQVGKSEILELLRRSLLSKTPLTDVFLENQYSAINGDAAETKQQMDPLQSTQKREGIAEADEPKRIVVKLLQTTDSSKILFAEAGEDLVDLLFSFLTFPLGSIVKLLGEHSNSMGCIGHLYNSVEELSQGRQIRPERRSMLLDPKLAPHHGYSGQLLKIDEMPLSGCCVRDCLSCFLSKLDECSHGGKEVIVTRINPKLPNSGTETGGGFAKRSVRFMVTNKMEVMSLSSSSVFKLIKDSKLQVSSLVVKEVTIAEPEALKLLKACMTSRTCLTQVFFDKKRRSCTEGLNTTPWASYL